MASFQKGIDHSKSSFPCVCGVCYNKAFNLFSLHLQVKGHSIKKRWYHSATVSPLSSDLAEVVIFGGRDKHYVTLSHTTVLRFGESTLQKYRTLTM